MKHIITAAAATFALLANDIAQAETVGIAASRKGSLYDRSGTVIAKVVTNQGGLRATLRNFTSPSVYIPAINRGQVAFGLANRIEIALAVAGQGHFKGRKHPNIRAVTIMYPLRIAFFVKKDSPIKTIADLKGKKVPGGFVAQKIILKLMDAEFETAGMTRKDISAVPVPNIVAGANAFITGKTDTFLFALGAPKVREANAKHGIRALPIANTPDKLAAVRKHLSVAYLKPEKPRKSNPGILAPMHVIAYDAMVFTHKDASADAVYKLTKAMHGNKKALAKAFPVFNGFQQASMAKDLGAVKYHPGAIKFYKEKGLWPPKN
ncbi:MAG: TAXI family TRAP transporter solute-binding subunit [Alphaproteobacteria bacterium]|nr:TAXI family TRAP transporter solute-binding subunit [Alphaproteobacteria bacterium]